MTAIDTSRMFVPADAGERISFLGMELVWKVTAAMSRGAYVMFVQIAPPGTGVPMHVHHNEEESVFVIDGHVVLGLGDETFDLGPGDLVNLPRGVRHGFRITGSSPARILFTIDLSLTSDYETMFNALVGVQAGDFDRIRSVTAANGVEFIEPPSMP